MNVYDGKKIKIFAWYKTFLWWRSYRVITGIRRCGKSVLLEQIIEEIKDKTDEEHIIYINFENVEYEFIENYKDLNKYVKDRIVDNKKYYLFFDEIQNVDKWEKVLIHLKQH